MTRIEPNPPSPYADANPQYRHIFPTFIFCEPPAPGSLALAGCERLAVVPAEQMRSATDGVLPDGLCPACIAAMRGEELPEDIRPVSRCRECACFTDHDGLCSVCRQEAHAKWWAERVAVALDGTARRTLTPDEYDAAWHAVEAAAGEPGADPATVLLAVLNALGVQPPPTA